MNNDTDPNIEDEYIPNKRVIVLALVGLVGMGLCALFIATFILFRPDNISLVSKYFPSPTPTRTPRPTPTPVFESVTISPYEDFSQNYPYLTDYLPNWEPPLTPATLTYKLEVSQDQAVVISMGWCTTTESILEENLSNIQWSLKADGKPIDIETLYKSRFVDDSMACEGFDGLAEMGSEGEHIISNTLKINRDIYDGWDTYLAGEYTEIYIINVVH